jgi:hypothetical protein
MDSSGSEYGPAVGSNEHDNKSSVSVKDAKLLN